jgi:hypothetical protein
MSIFPFRGCLHPLKIIGGVQIIFTFEVKGKMSLIPKFHANRFTVKKFGGKALFFASMTALFIPSRKAIHSKTVLFKNIVKHFICMFKMIILLFDGSDSY